jgi:TolB-like protein
VRKIGVVLAVLLLAAGAGFGQMGKIAILPFSGGSTDEEGDGIAELFSFTKQVMDNFTVIPRTTITTAIEKETGFQISGMTNEDTIVRLGNQFGANFMMAGSISSLGSQNLLIVYIVKIDVIQQVAGDFLLYDSLDALSKNAAILEKMASNLVEMMQNVPPNLEKLAVLSLPPSGGVNEKEGDALAQLLSIYLIRAGKYAIYPRTKTLKQVEDEYKNQLSGATRDAEAVSIGRAVNPSYVLSVAARRIGSSNRFNGSILDLERGNQIRGGSEQYTALSDGMNAMDFLAKTLSGITVTDEERTKRTSFIDKTATAEEKARRREAAKDNFLKNSGVNFSGRIGIILNSAEADSPSAENDYHVDKFVAKDFSFNTEFRWHWLGLQTGINSITSRIRTISDSGVYSLLAQTETIQIPLLVGGNFVFKRFINLSAYGGFGFNVSQKGAGNDLETPSPLAFIVSADIGAVYAGVSCFIGVRYARNLEESVIVLTGDRYRYTEDILSLTLGAGYYLPFRKK